MMKQIKISVLNKEGIIQKERCTKLHTYLDYLDAYEEGDVIRIAINSSKEYLMVQLDEALPPTLVYLENDVWNYEVPIDKESRRAYSPKTFAGEKHYLWARYATLDEIRLYRNLACNPYDQKTSEGVYPHAKANVVTRGESTFSERNAIDGVIANTYHGNYPYQSWGINRQSDAQISISFGHVVEVDKIALVLRGDYPHDSYWTSAVLEFSDGTEQTVQLEKVLEHQVFTIMPRKITWIKLKDLRKAEDESPFPALTQIEVYGRHIV